MEIKNQTQTISYKGLTRQLSKEIFSRDGITKLDELYPHSRGIVGNLPPQWIKHMPQENRAENIKGLHQKLGYFISEVLPWRINEENASQTLTEILKEHHAIAEDASVEVSRVDSGYFGQGYKIENKSDKSKLFLKHFYLSNPIRDREYPGHGTLSEINTNTYIRKNFKNNSAKSMVPRFYYGDIHNRFYIEEFIEPENMVEDYRSIEFVKRHSILKDARRTFNKHHLNHSDIFDRNVVYYYDKNNQLKIKCFDMGGVEKFNWNWEELKEAPIIYESLNN